MPILLPDDCRGPVLRPGLLLLLLLAGSFVASASGPSGKSDAERAVAFLGPGYPYEESILLEAECAEVGSHLSIVEDESATSGAYVTTSTTVFPDYPDIDQATEADYLRLRIDRDGNYRLHFRVRQADPGPVFLWCRINGGGWDIYHFTTFDDPTENEAGWKWTPRFYDLDTPILFTETGQNTLDIAFPRAGIHFDQLYLEDDDASRKEFIRPFQTDFLLRGTNCPDFFNLPPVAIIYRGQEGYPGNYSIYDNNSYDPDGLITRYDFPPGPEGIENERETDRTYTEAGEFYAYLTVTDYYGATDTDSTLYRIVERTPPSDRTTFRLEGECAASGEEDRSRFVIPDVSAADAGRYYLAGSFMSQLAEGNCIRVNINGTGWNTWDIITLERSYYPGPVFNLIEGDNTLEFSYCNPGLEVDELILSPDSGYPDILNPELYKAAGDIVNVACAPAPGQTEFWLEAECAQVGSRWIEKYSAAASNGGYVVVPSGNATSAPPANQPANFVRFSVENAVAGTYQLQARINAPSGLDDSYWVRVNGGQWYAWKSGIRQNRGFQWNLLPGGGVTLSGGTNTVDFAYREDGTQLDKLYISSNTSMPSGTGTMAPACSVTEEPLLAVWLEAECADYGNAWTLTSDETASSGKYLVALDGNSLSHPPADLPENQISFTLQVEDISGERPLYLYALVDAPTNNDDSYWVRFNGGAWYAWKSGILQNSGFRWNRLPVPLTGAVNGLNVIDFAYRENGAKLDRLYLSSIDSLPADHSAADSACSDGGPFTLGLDAFCMGFYAGWKRYALEQQGERLNYVVYPGKIRHLEEPTENVLEQEAFYKFDLPYGGLYTLFLRMNAPDGTKNSVWVQIDDSPWIKMWEETDGSPLHTSGFEWREVNDDGNRVTFSLDAGVHTIHIANREPGTQLAQLYLTTGSEVPFDTVEASHDCSTTIYTVASPGEETERMSTTPQESMVDIFPNPAVNALTLQLQSPYVGAVDFVLYDAHGRRLQQFRVLKEDDFLSTRVDVADLPGGVYRLQVIEGDRQTTKSFVRQ